MEKRSTSEKLLPKASMKKFNGLPCMVPLPVDPKQYTAVKENMSPGLMTLQSEYKQGERRMPLPLIVDFENKNSENAQKVLLKKTTSALQLGNPNTASAHKPLTNHPFLQLGQQQRGSTNVRSPKNNRFKERLTHANHVLTTLKAQPDFTDIQDVKENHPLNAQRFSSTSKQNLVHNALKLSKLNPKAKSKRNILSIDPIMRREMTERESSRMQVTAAKLPEQIRKEDFMDLFIENMILKEKCKDNENIKKMLFENLLNSKYTESTYKQVPPPQSMPSFAMNKEPMSDPWFLMTQGMKPGQSHGKQERLLQTPDPKSNCCVNVINNNYHVNFVSPIKREGRKSDAHKATKRVPETAWRDKLMDYMQNNPKQNAFKKRSYGENIRQSTGGVTTPGQTLFSNNERQDMPDQNQYTDRVFKMKASPFKQKSPDKQFRPTKVNIPINFLEDSTTHRESDNTDMEEKDVFVPFAKMGGGDAKCDTLNFTFSNFKGQAK